MSIFQSAHIPMDKRRLSQIRCVHMNRVFTVLVLCVSLAIAADAGFNRAKLADIDAAITAAIGESRLPGGVFWLERKGEHYSKAYGQRALVPARETMTTDTIFDAASLTKVVACAPAVMMLIERGKIGLDDTVQTY